MKNISLFASILIACVLLAGCKPTPTPAANATGNSEIEDESVWNKARDVVGVGHPKPPPSKAAQNRYCYHTYGDIICYSQPIAGEEYRLVGYQESNGKSGYTLPPAYILEDGVATTTLPTLKQQQVGMPPSVLGVSGPTAEKKPLKEVIFDPTELEPKELVPDKQE